MRRNCVTLFKWLCSIISQIFVTIKIALRFLFVFFPTPFPITTPLPGWCEVLVWQQCHTIQPTSFGLPLHQLRWVQAFTHTHTHTHTHTSLGRGRPCATLKNDPLCLSLKSHQKSSKARETISVRAKPCLCHALARA